jgi:hypothetical protein
VVIYGQSLYSSMEKVIECILFTCPFVLILYTALVHNKYERHVLKIHVTFRGESLHNVQITAWRFYNSVQYIYIYIKKVCLEGYNTLSSNSNFAGTEYNILYIPKEW